MTPRISLGKCTDLNIPKIAEMRCSGKVKAGDAVIRGGKEYYVAPTVAYTHTKNNMGDVRKAYSLNNEGEWHLVGRKVNNERGSYRRGINTLMGTDEVSLGGQQVFIRQADGTYLQSAFAQYPAKIASAEEIEAAINYVKGKGAAEDYTRLLRDYKN